MALGRNMDSEQRLGANPVIGTVRAGIQPQEVFEVAQQHRVPIMFEGMLFSPPTPAPHPREFFRDIDNFVPIITDTTIFERITPPQNGHVVFESPQRAEPEIPDSELFIKTVLENGAPDIEGARAKLQTFEPLLKSAGMRKRDRIPKLQKWARKLDVGTMEDQVETEKGIDMLAQAVDAVSAWRELDESAGFPPEIIQKNRDSLIRGLFKGSLFKQAKNASRFVEATTQIDVVKEAVATVNWAWNEKLRALPQQTRESERSRELQMLLNGPHADRIEHAKALLRYPRYQGRKKED